MITHHMINVEIACLPKDLPEYLEVDLANLRLGSSLHLSEIPLPGGIQLIHSTEGDHDEAVASIVHRGGTATESTEDEETYDEDDTLD